MDSKEDLNKDAVAFFNSTQWQRLNNFFEEHGETVYNIFNKTVKTSGVMALFIVVNGLNDTFKDFLLSLEHDSGKPNLLPEKFDEVKLKHYLLPVHTEESYVLKCKKCDFISYLTCTMEHMAFVHNIHHGFELTMNISNNSNNIPAIKRCIFETRNSKIHRFRDHFTLKIDLENKKKVLEINKNSFSRCYTAYIRNQEKKGKLYTINTCKHESQIIRLVEGKHENQTIRPCECMQETIDFYQKFHTEIFELLKIVDLTNKRQESFQNRLSLKPKKHNKKEQIKIFEEFQKRIVKENSDFFTKDNDDKYTNPTAAEKNGKSGNKKKLVIKVEPSDRSSCSHEDTSSAPSAAAIQASVVGKPIFEETQSGFHHTKKSTEIVLDNTGRQSFLTNVNEVIEISDCSNSSHEDTSSVNEVIEISDSSNSSHEDTSPAPSATAIQTSVVGTPISEETQSGINHTETKIVLDKSPKQDTLENFLNKHFNLNECKSNLLEFPAEYIESVVDDSSKISNKVDTIKNDLLGGSLQCDPMEEYGIYKTYNDCLSMLKSEHEKSIEQFKLFQNEPYEESVLSILKSLESEDNEMDVVQPQTQNDYKDILKQYSIAQKLNFLCLDELNKTNAGSAIFGDILNEYVDSVPMQEE